MCAGVQKWALGKGIESNNDVSYLTENGSDVHNAARHQSLTTGFEKLVTRLCTRLVG